MVLLPDDLVENTKIFRFKNGQDRLMNLEAIFIYNKKKPSLNIQTNAVTRILKLNSEQQDMQAVNPHSGARIQGSKRLALQAIPPMIDTPLTRASLLYLTKLDRCTSK